MLGFVWAQLFNMTNIPDTCCFLGGFCFGFFCSLAMAVDWIGFGYAAAIALGGFMGYKRKGERSHQVKLSCPTVVTIWLIINPIVAACLCLIAGSVMSLMAGLVFGGLSAYGALNVTSDPKDIKVSLCKFG